MELVNIKNLSFKYFDNKILHNINMSIQEGEKILLIGPNGAGKSTLLRLIAGLHMSIQYENFDVLGTNSPCDQLKGLAYLGNRWQRNVSFCGVSAYMVDIKVGDMMKKWQLDNIERRNELVNVLDINLEWKMHEISDGQRKRVQIMLALLKPFKLLIIDEFLNELDVVIRHRFYKYLNKECVLRNGGIIYATHIFDNLSNWADKIIYISNGTCKDKLSIKDFNKCNNLFESVKNAMEKDYQNNSEDIIKIKPLKFGPQFGYGSGRSSNIKNI